ncbi:MAG: efflux RND transporter permease subunit, partial [Planctomycetaceae bacterium]|nr:efflux RND transporter permease subunit [Planctomycetaceae bacterium]
MLNGIIRFSLTYRPFVIACALFLTGYGAWQAASTPIDVFPDLNRPRVVVMTEAPGLAPEDVETLVTIPLETALNGAVGVQDVRSSSGVGISVVYVEFDWDTDIYVDRQIVAEKIQTAQERMPPGVTPQLAPISSIMGQILMLAMFRDSPSPNAADLQAAHSPEPGQSPSSVGISEDLELRTAADWTVRQRLLTIPGVAQVFTMGGGRRQFQVLVDPDALLRFGVTLHDVKQALVSSNENGSGGYLDQQGPNELLVRTIGRLQTVEDLQKVCITIRDGRPVALDQIARVVEAAQVKRGDSSAWIRSAGGHGAQTDSEQGSPEPRESSPNSAPAETSAAATTANWQGGPAVVLTINKQPGADTRRVTADVLAAVRDLQPTLPADVRIIPVYSQSSFIDRAIANVVEALRDGGILVVLILFVFLMNLRTTVITLTAIPLSIMMTAIVFAAFGLSINTMTLGGLAVAIGELVDDAIVDVENIYRRLRENRLLTTPRSALRVVYDASLEVVSSIVFGTMIVILVFVPLFALSGMEGRLFAPLGVAYIVSILSSLIVSLTVTPVLSFWLLGRGSGLHGENDGIVLRVLKALARVVIHTSLTWPRTMLCCTLLLVAIAGLFVSRLEKDFLPPFNEGAVQLNVILPPGTSLATSNHVNQTVEQRLLEIDDINHFVRRTGRAELDEHAEGVNLSEYILELNPDSPRTREQQLADIREAMADIPGIVTAVEQPIAHLISHMLSGVKAQVGIKLYGDDLDVLRRNADQLKVAVSQVPGVTDLLVEPQVLIPQLRLEMDRDKLLQYGLTAGDVNEFIETAMNGNIVSQMIIGQRSFDLLLRMDNDYREDLERLKRLTIELPDGGRIPLQAVVRIYESSGPNTINREDVKRRIVIQCNVQDRGVVDVVSDIRRVAAPVLADMPEGYFLEYGGQFESQQSASRVIGLLSLVSLVGVFLVL